MQYEDVKEDKDEFTVGRYEESVPTLDKKKKAAARKGTPSREGSQEAYDSAPEEQGTERGDNSKEEAEESGNDSEASGSVRRSERAEAKKDVDYTGKSARVIYFANGLAKRSATVGIVLSNVKDIKAISPDLLMLQWYCL